MIDMNHFQATLCAVAGGHHQSPHASLMPGYCSAAVGAVAEVAAAADGVDDRGGG